MCAVYTLGTDAVFTTEGSWRNKNPHFTTQMTIIPKFNDQQLLKFALLELTPTIKPLSEYNVIGDVVISLGQILVNGGVEATLMGGAGDVKIEVNQASHGRGVLSMIVAFVSMPKDHWLMKNYPQLVICKRVEEEDDWSPVFSSEIIKRSETGQWAPISLPCRLICDSDYTKPIRLLVQDAEPGKPIIPVGHVDLSVKQAGEAHNLRLGLIPANPKSARAGSIIIRAANLIERLTFYGHIKQGLRFNFACSIDFAASNRPPRDTKSLHYTSIGHKNNYELCIDSIGGIVEQYSEDKHCFAWGFAARMNRQLNHAFSLTSTSGQPKLTGVKDILNAYWRIFEKIQFDKPVSVCPSTSRALELVKGKKDQGCYLVFMLLIDDDPIDLNSLVDLLYLNQFEPISVIVIGIGENEFAKTEEKFRPGIPHKNSQGQEFERDFVIFIRFNDFGSDNIAQLASTALFSIPDQAVHWVEVNTM